MDHSWMSFLTVSSTNFLTRLKLTYDKMMMMMMMIIMTELKLMQSLTTAFRHHLKPHIILNM